MRFELPKIQHNYKSFEVLAKLYEDTKDVLFDEIVIDMQNTNWFDADMCAAFGAILYSLGDRLNKVNIVHIPNEVETILSKNGFLSHYGRLTIPDRWGTTIPYQRFDVEDDHFFANYIQDELLYHFYYFLLHYCLLEMKRDLAQTKSLCYKKETRFI